MNVNAEVLIFVKVNRRLRDMKQRRNLIRLLFDRKRIEMNSRHHNLFVYAFLLMMFILVVSVGYFSLSLMHNNFITSLTFGALGLTIFISIILIYKKIRSISIIGDVVILKSLIDKSEVTNIQSVRSVTSSKFLNVHFTLLRFRLDGSTRKVFAIINANIFRTSPESAFRKALQISEKEKERANHKPGSVLRPESECLSFI